MVANARKVFVIGLVPRSSEAQASVASGEYPETNMFRTNSGSRTPISAPTTSILFAYGGRVRG